AFVRLKNTVEYDLGLIEESIELRPHQVMTELELGRIDIVVIGARHNELAELNQALLRKRMRLQVGIDALHANQLLSHVLESLEHAAAGLMRGIEEGHAGL